MRGMLTTTACKINCIVHKKDNYNSQWRFIWFGRGVILGMNYLIFDNKEFGCVSVIKKAPKYPNKTAYKHHHIITLFTNWSTNNNFILLVTRESCRQRQRSMHFGQLYFDPQPSFKYILNVTDNLQMQISESRRG